MKTNFFTGLIVVILAGGCASSRNEPQPVLHPLATTPAELRVPVVDVAPAHVERLPEVPPASYGQWDTDWNTGEMLPESKPKRLPPVEEETPDAEPHGYSDPDFLFPGERVERSLAAPRLLPLSTIAEALPIPQPNR